MTFARVKGRPSAPQRRCLQLIEAHGSWSAKSVRPATRAKLIALGYAEVVCRSCRSTIVGDAIDHAEIAITAAGRKYLTNWRRAYGAGVD